MALKKAAAAAGAMLLLLAGCSQTDVAHSDGASESGEGEDEADRTSDDRGPVQAIEDAIEQQYEAQHFDILRSEIAPDGADAYAGEIELHDRLMDRNTTVDCRITVSGTAITSAGCEDREPASAQLINDRIDVALRGTSDEGVRDQLLLEAQSSLGGGGRQLERCGFERDGDAFLITCQTRLAEGGESWQAGCAGELRPGSNGRQAASLHCRQRP